MNLKQNLYTMRKNMKKSQDEIALVLGIKQQQYQRYESGANAMPVEYYVKLAKYYGVTVDYLLGISEN